jgi:diacylglycerol kinase (ATP)
LIVDTEPRATAAPGIRCAMHLATRADGHTGAGTIPAMTNPHKGRTGIDRIVRAAGHSFHGLHAAYTGESAFRQELWLALLMVPAAFWVGRDWLQVSVLVGSVMLVLIVELLNSGIEATIDRVSYEMHELSRRAKDLASAAVFLSLLLCGGIWLAALWHRFLGT